MKEPQAGPVIPRQRAHANIKKARRQRDQISSQHRKCCIPECPSRKEKNPKVQYHQFPPKNSGIKVPIINSLGEKETIDKRKAWEKALCMGKLWGRPITNGSMVCSIHFRDVDYCAQGSKAKLRKFAVPSLNLPEDSFVRKQIKSSLHHRKMLMRKKLKEEQNQSETLLSKTTMMDDNHISEKPISYNDMTIAEKVVASALPEINKCSNEDCSGTPNITFNDALKAKKIVAATSSKINQQMNEDCSMSFSDVTKTEKLVISSLSEFNIGCPSTPQILDASGNHKEVVISALPNEREQNCEVNSNSQPISFYDIINSDKKVVTALQEMNEQLEKQYNNISVKKSNIEAILDYNVKCCVRGCQSTKVKDPELHFHKFPEKNNGISVKTVNSLGQVGAVDQKIAWETVLFMGKTAPRNYRVCSRHFREVDYWTYGELRKGVVPSQSLPKTNFMEKQLQPNPHEEILLKGQTSNIEQSSSGILVCETAIENDDIIENENVSFKVLTNKKVVARLQKEVDDLKKTNRRLQKEREGSLKNLSERRDFRSYPEKLALQARSNSGSSEKDFRKEEELQQVKSQRDRLKQQLKRLEDDYQALKEKRIQDLTALQEAHERETANYVASVTPLREQLELQQVSISTLQQQLTAAKEELAVVKAERDHLNTRLLSACPATKDSGDVEVEALLKKISYLEKRYEEREYRLRAIVQNLAQKSITNRSCEQCAERQQQLISYKVELDQLLATVRALH